MSLLDDVKMALRLTTDALNAEVETLIDAARYDMERVGVDPNLLAKDPLTDNIENAFVKQAICVYAKAHFGYDNAEAPRFDDSYRRIVCDLLNSSRNIAAIERETEPEGDTDSEGGGE